MSIVNTIKNKFINKTWKFVTFSIIAITPIIAIPIVAVVNSTSATLEPTEMTYYRYNDIFFSDKSEVLKYVEQEADEKKEIVGVDNTYYLDDKVNDNETVKFTQVDEYHKYLSKYIVPFKTQSALKIEEIENQLDGSDSSVPLNITKHLNFSEKDNSIDIYRGYNGEIFTNENDAKNSYYRTYDGYQFNDIFFRSKEELMYYLKNVFFSDPLNVPKINEKYIIEVYNDNNQRITSSPISLLQNDDQTKLNKFAQETLQSSLTYSYFDKSENKDVPFVINSKQDINKLIQNTDAKQALLNDLKYFKAYQTNGNSGFLVDTLAEDKSTFIGKNYVEANEDINAIANKENWQSYNETNYKPFEGTINKSISNMLNYFAFESPYSAFETNNALKTEANWFNYADLTFGEQNSINTKFRNQMYALGQSGINLFNDVLNNAVAMEKQKNFNNFLKIPTLYTIAMNLIYNRELSYEITTTVQDYFVEIAYFLDQKLYNLVPVNILKSPVNLSYFSYVDFFNLNNNDFNFNQNIGDLYLNKIKTNFPYLAIFALFQNAPITNHQTTLGVWEYDKEFFDTCVSQYVDLYINNDSEKQFIINELNSNTMQKSFQYIWDLYSVPNADGLLDLFDSDNTKQVFSDNRTAIEILHTNFYPRKLKEIVDFITYIDAGANLATANSFVYYKDVNTRTRLLNFTNILRQIEAQGYRNYQHLIPKGVSLAEIKAAVAQLDSIYNESSLIQQKTRAKQTVYRSKAVTQISNTYIGWVKNTFEGQAEYSKGISAIYNGKNNGSEFFQLNSLEKGSLDFKLEQERLAIFNSTATVEFEEEIYISEDKLEKYAKKLEKYAKVGKGLASVIQRISSGFYSDTTGGLVGGGALKFLRDVLDTGIIGMFGPIASIAQTILSFIMPEIKDLSYVFQLDEANKWYRKGGNSVSMFFGLLNFTVGGIDEMKIAKPIPLYKNIDADRYYYNGKKYPEAKLDTLIADQLYDIFKGKIRNPNFKQKFYFKSKSCIDNPNQIVYYEDANSAIQGLITNLSTNITVNNDWIANVVRDYDGELTNTENEAIEIAITKITSTAALRPTTFINLPYLKNGSVDLEKEHLIQNFQYPVAWDQASNELVYATNTNQLIINNPIYEYQANMPPTFTRYEYASQDFQSRFLNSFNILTKKTLASELLYINNFDHVANNVTPLILYKIEAPSIQQKFFVSKEHALDYLKKVFNFKVATKNLEKSTFYFEDQIYLNIYEIEQHILNNLIPMTQKEYEDYINSLNQGGNLNA